MENIGNLPKAVPRPGGSREVGGGRVAQRCGSGICMIAGGNHTLIPSSIARPQSSPLRHTSPVPPGSQRTHASPGQGRWLFVWAKSRRGSQTFPNSYMAPCRGRSFLATTRKEPKNRLRGGAISVVYPPLAQIETHYPDPKAPSPGYPSRRCASVTRSVVLFYRRNVLSYRRVIVGAIIDRPLVQYSPAVTGGQ